MLRYNGDVECIMGHLIPINSTIAVIISLAVCALFIYIAYTVILVKFYRQKRRLKQVRNVGRQGKKSEGGCISVAENRESKETSNHPAKSSEKISNTNTGLEIMRSISKGILIMPGVNHVLKSITAAKYILTILTVLSLTWLPWVATLYHDISTHKQESIETPTNTTTNQLVQECVYTSVNT